MGEAKNIYFTCLKRFPVIIRVNKDFICDLPLQSINGIPIIQSHPTTVASFAESDYHGG